MNKNNELPLIVTSLKYHMPVHRISSYFLTIFCLFSLDLQSQEPIRLSQMEDTLISLQRKILKTDNDTIRQSLNDHFRQTLKKAIEIPGSFFYPFDSLKKVSKITSKDKKFRIYNWNLPLTNGSNFYFCFLQVQDKGDHSNFTTIDLIDKSDSLPDPEHSILNFNCWYGALYYQIIPENTDAGMIYTLLGWEGTSSLQMQKVIDILVFDGNNCPHFGKKIFNKYQDGEQKRVIFKYSPLSTMVLRYEEQSVSYEKKWNPTHRTFDDSQLKKSMIVCDRIVTMESPDSKTPILIPAGDIYDGFIFENNRWNFIEGVDARNR